MIILVAATDHSLTVDIQTVQGPFHQVACSSSSISAMILASIIKEDRILGSCHQKSETSGF